ncbi:MAG TPA: DUF4435 domain-containing protein [Nostocaceae cyanobacterium]|nr:DUF4435 domain-containing protein [Nostocaceae cyanobacterium]
MPISFLYCEGNGKSYDIILLSKILLNTKCKIIPLGGRNFIEKIIADRTVNPNLAGIVDRDFDDYNFTPTNTPIPYNYQGIQVGWKWERKEIENYLIDPLVVQRTIRNRIPSMEAYREALEKAARQIAVYAAARTALASFKFKNCWGDKIENVFSSNHFFPRSLNREACEQNIREIVNQNKGDRIVTAENVLNRFEELIPLFKDGVYFENYLTFFAGKDLLCAMKDDLKKFGFQPTARGLNSPIPVFLERIITRITPAEDVWTWLPEWQALRDEFMNIQF